MASISVNIDPEVKLKNQVKKLSGSDPLLIPFSQMTPDELEIWIESALAQPDVEIKDLFILLAKVVQYLHKNQK